VPFSTLPSTNTSKQVKATTTVVHMNQRPHDAAIRSSPDLCSSMTSDSLQLWKVFVASKHPAAGTPLCDECASTSFEIHSYCTYERVCLLPRSLRSRSRKKAIENHLKCEAVKSERSDVKPRESHERPTEWKAPENAQAALRLVMEFLACIVNCWTTTAPAVHSVLNTQHLFLVILHSAGV
jgi:hypothetical protein